MSQHVLYHTVEIDGLSIFYRETGPEAFYRYAPLDPRRAADSAAFMSL
jgi:hypothetical protein